MSNEAVLRQTATQVASDPDDAANAPLGGPVADRLRLVIDSLPEGFGLLAPDFTILDINKHGLQLDRRSRAELIGQSHWVAYPGTEHSDVGRMYKKAMRERLPLTLRHWYEHPDAGLAYREMRALPLEDGNLAVFFRELPERGNHAGIGLNVMHFAAAMKAIDGILWTNSADGKMVGEQPSWAAFTGQTFDAYQGYGWSAVVHPDDVQPSIDAWEAAVAARKTFEFEHRVRRHDGQWRLCAIRAVPVIGDDFTVVEWVGIHRDVTESRAQALRLHHMAETIDAVFYVHELDEQRISYVSRAYEHIWGQTRDALYANARDFMNVVHPDDIEALEIAQRKQLAGHTSQIEYRLLRSDGNERIIADRAIATADPVTGERRVVGLATDITEYRHAQALLARNAETFANLVMSNPFGIYVVDIDFRLINVSKGAERVFGGVERLIGRDFAEVIRIAWPEPIASDAIDIFRHTMTTGEPYISVSSAERRADTGNTEAYDWRVERITLPDGRYGVVCYFYDLSERNAYEAKLKQAIDDKDLLAREIDHRAKNSLSVVGAMLRMQRLASKSAETRAALDDAAARVIAVARVHESLHKSDILGVVDFGQYLETLCEELSSTMQREGVELRCICETVFLPAADAMSVALIASELVTNAYKHGCPAGASKIEISLTTDGDMMTLIVSDNGAGLPNDAPAYSGSLGLKMVGAMARQLNAVTTFPSAGMPAKFMLRVPRTLQA